MIQQLNCLGILTETTLYFIMFIVGSLIFLWAHKIFTSGAHMAPRKIHEVASLKVNTTSTNID